MNGAIGAPQSRLSFVPAASGGVSASGGRLCFDRFVLAPCERLLIKNGAPVDIGGRTFDLLLALVQQAGRVVPKRELIQRVWPDVVVEDAALRFHMTRLRKILDDGRADARLITTQVGVGYAFVGIVRRAEARAPLAPWPAAGRPAPRLPSRVDRMIGRDRDLRGLIERLATTRLLTIVGAAGIGKTSLAIEVAHDLEADFDHGADFIDLADIHLPDRLAPTIARTLRAEIGADGPATAVLDHLRGRRQLLVLDNCEHLLEAVAGLAEQIAVAAPEVRILATSRQALRARDEHVHRLAPHAVLDDEAEPCREALLACSAVDLFLHHAARAGGAVGQDLDSLRAVARLCGRLDGVALAIELAAVRAATHGIDATLKMLGDRLSLLWPGRRTAPPRQRTLKAALDWSYDLLSDPERRVFERLSKLGGVFSRETGLAAITDRALDASIAAAALDELAEKSLIASSDGRYRWSEITRIYANGQLDARLDAAVETVAPLSLRVVARAANDHD